MNIELNVNSSELVESLKDVIKNQVQEELAKQKRVPVMVTPEWVESHWCMTKPRAQRLFREFAEECLRPDSPIRSEYIELTSKIRFASPEGFEWFMRHYNELKDEHQREALKRENLKIV